MAEGARAFLRNLFDDLGVTKAEAGIRPENKPSTALARRLGFRLEGGPIRDRWLVSGQWHNVMIYGLIAGEERQCDRHWIPARVTASTTAPPSTPTATYCNTRAPGSATSSPGPATARGGSG